MTKILIEEATLKLAMEALNTTESDCGSRAWEREQEAITAIKQVRALDKKAENARELGLDYGPVTTLGGGLPVYDTPPVQEPVGEIGWGGSVNWHKAIPEFGTDLYTAPPAQPAHLAQVVRAHIQDLRACLPTLREHKLSDTAAEVEKAANELEAAAAQPAPVPSTLPDFSPIFDGITKGGAA
jgi:hypothetical protein